MLVVDPCIEKAQQEFFWHCKLWSSGGRNSSLMYLWSEELWSHKHSHKILCQIFIETVSDNLYFPHDRIKVLYLFQLWQKSSNYRCKYLKRHLAPVTLVYRNTNQQLICEQSIEQHALFCFLRGRIPLSKYWKPPEQHPAMIWKTTLWKINISAAISCPPEGGIQKRVSLCHENHHLGQCPQTLAVLEEQLGPKGSGDRITQHTHGVVSMIIINNNFVCQFWWFFLNCTSWRSFLSLCF